MTGCRSAIYYVTIIFIEIASFSPCLFCSIAALPNFGACMVPMNKQQLHILTYRWSCVEWCCHPNHSFVLLDNIGQKTEALFCLTDLPACY